MTETPKQDAMTTAAQLIAGGGLASLAVSDLGDGAPFVTMVTFAADDAHHPLLLISDLAHHAKCLRANGRAALLIQGPPAAPDPMLTFRVTLQGVFAPTADEAPLKPFLARHPYAELYAGFGDFHIWRMVPEHAHIVAGFGRAYGVRFKDVAELASKPA